MKISEIGLLANPGSTRVKTEIVALRAAIGGYPDLHYRELSDMAEVPAILRDFAGLGIRLLLIVGGDGTIQAVGTSLALDNPFANTPVLATLPGGHTNMTAESLGLVGDFKPMLDALMEAAESDSLETVKLPFLRMQLAPDREPVLGIFFGAATVVRGMQFTRRTIYPLGLPNGLAHFLAISYLMTVAASPFKTKRSPMRREPIGVRFGETASNPRSYVILIVTTLEKLILGIHTASGVGEGPLRYTSIDYKFSAILRSVWTFLFGRPTEKLVRGLVRRRAAVIEISTESAVTLDGEFFDPVPGHPVRLEATEPFVFVHMPDEV